MVTVILVADLPCPISIGCRKRTFIAVTEEDVAEPRGRLGTEDHFVTLEEIH